MRSSSRLAKLLSVLALLTGACTAGETSETTTEDTSFATTTLDVSRPTFDMANFSMDQVITEPSLTWSESFSMETHRPLGLVRHGDEWFLFTSPDMSREGLTAWSSIDGRSWQQIGVVVPAGPDVGAIEVVDKSIVIATGGDSGTQPALWLSDNGSDWTREGIPIEVENQLLAFTPMAMGGDGETLVIAGRSQVDAADLIESKVKEVFGPEYDIDRFGYTLNSTGEDVEITLLGPLGFSMLTTSAIELGIGEPELSWLAAEPDTAKTEVWLRFDPTDWVPRTIEGARDIVSIAAAPEGGLIAVGFTWSEQIALWESLHDGYIWDQVPFDVRPYDLGRWNDFLIGPSSVGSHDVLISENGTDWTTTGLSNLLPPSLAWTFPALTANPDEVLTIVEAWDSLSRTGPTLEFPLIERDGLIISVEANRGVGRGISVFEGPLQNLEDDREIFADSWSASSAADSQRVVINPGAETVQLLRDDGSELVVLTFDELEGLLVESFRYTQSFQTRFRAIARTEDGRSWAISNLPDIGDDRDIVEVGATDFSIFVVTTDHISESGVQVWTAPLP